MNEAKHEKKYKYGIIEIVFTIITILSPLLHMYGISEKYHTFTFREVSLILMSIVCFLFIIYKNIKIKRITLWASVYILTVLISMLLSLNDDGSSSFLRILRYLVILIYIFSFSKFFFNPELGFKIYDKLVIFASIFLIIQVVSANYFNIEVKGYFSFMPVRSIDIRSANGLLRFYSIFEEPGYYGMIVSGYLILAFQSKKLSMSRFLLISAASFLSTATTSIVLLIFSIGVCVINSIIKNILSKNKKRNRENLLLVGIMFIVFLLFTLTPQFDFVVKRITDGVSANSRFGDNEKYIEIFSMYNITQGLFGNAMTDFPMNGYLAVLVSFGIIGLTSLIALILTLFLKSNSTGRLLIIVFAFTNIANLEFFGNASTLIIFFSFVLHNLKNNQIEQKEKKYEVCTVV